MQTATIQAKLAFETSPVKRKYKCFIDWITKGSTSGVITAGEFNSTYFAKENVANDEDFIIYKPFILSDSMRLGDNVRLVSNKYENGWLGANRSSSLGVFASAEVISMIYTLTTPANHITVFGSRYNYPVNMDLYYRNSIDTAWVLCQSYTAITSYITVYTFPTVTTIKGWKVEITKINLADMFACIAEVQAGFREDVTADLTLNPMDITKELEYSGASVSLGNISANILTLRLNNTSQKYNPKNTSSYLYPFLKYNKIIQPFIGIDLGDTIEWFAQGKYYLRSIDPKPDMTVEIYAVDRLYFLNAEDFSSSIVYENYTKSELQQMLVEDFGLGATEYDIDSTTSLTPYAYFESLKYAEAIKRLEIADGGVAFFDELGIFNSKTRGWTETGVAAYYDDSNIKKDSASSPVISNSMKNYIRIKSNPLDSAAQEIVYNSSQSIMVPGGGLAVCDNYSESNNSANLDLYSGSVTIDSYNEGNYNTSISLFTGSNVAIAQSFTGDGNVLNSCKFYLKKYGSPTGNAVVKIYAHTGTFGVDGKPTGVALATSDNFNVATLTTPMQLIPFTFTGANKITPINGTKYCVSIEYGGGDASNQVQVGIDSTSPTHNGNFSNFFGATWYPDAAYDICFYVYGNKDSKIGQSITGNGEILDSCKFYLKKAGSPTGSAYAKIYTHSGTFGTTSVPTGAALATSDAFEVANLTTSLQLITFTFTGANKITLTNATKYVLTIEYTGGDGSNGVLVGIDNTSPTHAGNCSEYILSWVYAAGFDLCFYVYTGSGVTYTKDVACYFTKKPCINIVNATFTQSSTHIKVISESKYSFVTFLTFTNTGVVDENILTIEIQAKPLAATGANEVVAQDVDLISIYGKSEYLIDSEFIQDMVTAQTLADDLLVDYKDPEPLELGIEAPSKPYLQLGDTVLIRNSKLNIGG